MYYIVKPLHKVSVVFRLVDDFSGKILSEPYFYFFACDKYNRRLVPIRKPEGFFVITDELDLSNTQICIRSPFYCDSVISDFSSVTGQNPIITVRLKPGINYPLKPGTTAYTARFFYLDGKPAPGLDVAIHAPYREGMIKLKAIQIENDVAAAILTNPYGLDFTGLTLSVSSEEAGEPPITFSIVRKIDNNTFEIDKKLADISVESAVARRVYSSITNSSGQVLIPIETMGSSEFINVELYASDGKNNYHRDFSIKNGKIEYYEEHLNW